MYKGNGRLKGKAKGQMAKWATKCVPECSERGESRAEKDRCEMIMMRKRYEIYDDDDDDYEMMVRVSGACMHADELNWIIRLSEYFSLLPSQETEMRAMFAASIAGKAHFPLPISPPTTSFIGKGGRFVVKQCCVFAAQWTSQSETHIQSRHTSIRQGKP